MPKEFEKIEKQPIEGLFSEPDTILFLHSKSTKRIAWLIQGLQRLIGRQNVSFQRPWLNKKTGKWTLKIVLDIPDILLKQQKGTNESNLPKEEGAG